MKKEFSPFGFGGPIYPPFPSLETNGSPSELIPYGRAKVAKVGEFPELNGRRAALLKWSWLNKQGQKMIVFIGRRKGYDPGSDVQIIRFTRPDKDAAYYTRPMAGGNDQWGQRELFPITEALFRKLDRAYSFKA